jgi:acyl-CoA oxidase
MTGPRAKAITRRVNDLCGELRGHADVLVDAFGIPDAVLRAPIGLKRP